jgi:hypothetical protein
MIICATSGSNCVGTKCESLSSKNESMRILKMQSSEAAKTETTKITMWKNFKNTH